MKPVLAHLSVISLGWAFVVRWGWPALPFLVLTILYAVAQLPAYFSAFIADPSMYGIQSPAAKDLAPIFSELKGVFPLLVVGKLLFAMGFMSLFMNSPQPDFSVAEYWPNSNAPRIGRRAVRLAWRIALWGGSVATAALTGALTVAAENPIGSWVKKLLALLGP